MSQKIIELEKEILGGLNKQQVSVVLNSFKKDSLVIAGAGSGKTATLIARIKYLLAIKKVPADSICCITFTKKAAKELLDRAEKAIGKEAYNMWVGTFHSVCIRLLRLYGEDIGIKQGFTILTPYYSKKQAKELIARLGGEADSVEVRNFLKRISNLKNNLQTPKAVRDCVMKRCNGDYEKYCEDRDYLFSEFFSLYQKENMENNTLDFDDCLAYTIVLLKMSKGAQLFIKKTFKYVSCDEFQDSNPCNMLFLDLVSKDCNLFVVGDESQCIYEFRGSRPEYILNFTKRENSKLFKLEQNYRSTKTIVEASNFVIEKNDDRVDKTCFSEGAVGEKIKLNTYANDRAEAFNTAIEIRRLYNKGYKLEDIYILFRVNSQTMIYEKEFIKQNIPYCMIGTKSFSDRKEILDLTAYLKILANPKDKQSFKRVLEQTPGVGKKAIGDLMVLFKDNDNLVDVLSSYKTTKKTAESIGNVIKYLSLQYKDCYELIKPIALKYIEKLLEKDTEENNTRIDNIKILLEIIKEKKDLTVLELVDELDLSSTTDNEEESGKVSFLTMHSAKGLESKVVFIAGCNEQIIPHSMSLKEGRVNSERRLMYVAMTRAKELLYINTHSYDSRNEYEPSRFIAEIPDKFIEEEEGEFDL